MEDEKLRTRVKPHGPHQIEIKNRYPLLHKKKTVYEVDVFLLTPHHFGLDKERYGRDTFYENLKAYTRYTIHEIPLRRLADKEDPISPLYTIAECMKKLPGDGTEQHEIVYELRSLSNFYTTQIKNLYRNWKRDYLQGSKHTMEPPPMELHPMEPQKRLVNFLRDMDNFLKSFRELFEVFEKSEVGKEAEQALCWSDETISLATERILLNLSRILKKYPDADFPMDNSVQDYIEQMAFSEKEERRVRDYGSSEIDRNAVSGEIGLKRESLLKKWSQQIMYLTREYTKVQTNIGHLLASIAAAVAMSFAIIITFFADSTFKTYSLPWALVIVVSYMLKDRIKEVLRSLLNRILPRLLADTSEKLVDLRKEKKVGSTKSIVQYMQESQLPQDFLRMMDRREDPLDRMQPDGNVLRLRKEIKLKSSKLLKEQRRVHSITEIIRFNIDHIVEEMDNPIKAVCSIDENGKISAKAMKRMYHFDLFIQLQEREKKHTRQVFWYDLALTQKGLERIVQRNTEE